MYTDLVTQLNKRRKIILYLIVLFSLLSIIVHFNYEVVPPEYFDGKYNMLFAYGMVLYKLIELPILYYILIHRHLLKIEKDEFYSLIYPKLEKQSKVLFFLVLQGNTIFGLITYKLSGSVLLFLLFMLIALVTTYIIKLNKLFS
ncbi:MAG: hypothetical protein Q9M32_02045 [Sulfurimonas sp.]|nr:hypothetical protein [Sulfurimonas sp.]